MSRADQTWTARDLEDEARYVSRLLLASLMVWLVMLMGAGLYVAIRSVMP